MQKYEDTTIGKMLNRIVKYFSMSTKEVCSLQANDTNILSDVPEELGNMLSMSIYAKYQFRIKHCRHKSLSLPFLEDHDLLMGIDKIAWPFILSGAWCVFFGLGYAILGKAINKHQTSDTFSYYCTRKLSWITLL